MNTGHKDNHGTEILKGNLLKHHFGVVKRVIWNEDKKVWQCAFDKGGGFVDPIEYFLKRNCEIVKEQY